MSDRSDFPWIYPPPGFNRIDRNNIAIISNPGATNISQDLETIKEVAQGCEGWITLVALVSSNFSKSFLTILEDGAPMKDYVRIVAQLGDTPTPRPCLIPLRGNRNYTLQATVLPGAVNISFRWTLFGWYYPLRRR